MNNASRTKLYIWLDSFFTVWQESNWLQLESCPLIIKLSWHWQFEFNDNRFCMFFLHFSYNLYYTWIWESSCWKFRFWLEYVVLFTVNSSTVSELHDFFLYITMDNCYKLYCSNNIYTLGISKSRSKENKNGSL